MTEHIDSCAQSEKRPCPANKSLHDEPKDAHWWSGWPGAHCMKCGDEDKNEVCLALGCHCLCHNEFWEAFEKEMAKKPKDLPDLEF